MVGRRSRLLRCNAGRSRRIDARSAFSSLALSFILLFLSPGLSGCGGLPRLNAAGEPVGLPEHVTSVRLDPRTMEPIEKKPVEKKPVKKKPVEEPKAKTARED